MRVEVWSYYSVDRSRVKFHCIRSSFDAPTDNYSGIIAGLSSDVSFIQKRLPGCIPPLSSQSNHTLDLVRLTPLCTVHPPLAHVRNFLEPKPGCRYRWVRIIPKHP